MNKIKAYIRIVRPHHYIKNLFIWLPLFFGNKLFNPEAILQTFYATVVFCSVAGCVYILNDYLDISVDRRHPVKRYRPLANGTLNSYEAFFCFSILFILSFSLSFLLLPVKLSLIIGLYMLLNAVYSMKLKRIAIVDIICIALGFILRIFAGGVAAEVHISHWLVIISFLTALFLALSKRWDDLILAAAGYRTRGSLEHYNREFVLTSMVVIAAVTIVSYILYTVSPEIIKKHGTEQLYLTAFWVIAGFLRYMQIVFVEHKSGSPSMTLLKDRFLRTVVIFWVISVYLLLYGFP